jgi:hypothetical protein
MLTVFIDVHRIIEAIDRTGYQRKSGKTIKANHQEMKIGYIGIKKQGKKYKKILRPLRWAHQLNVILYCI